MRETEAACDFRSKGSLADHSTKIQWTHAPGFKGETWNPIIAIHKETGKRGWHCEHASRGCDRCYAEAQNRLGIRMGTRESYTRAARDRVDIQLHEPTLLKPLSWKSPRCIFVCSMTDLFGEWVSDEWLDQIFAIMALCPQHRFMVLTKRSQRMREYLNRHWNADDHVGDYLRLVSDGANWECHFPLSNVWAGVTAEDQKNADARIPDLLACPAAVRFLSCEPLIGPIDLHRAIGSNALREHGEQGFIRGFAEMVSSQLDSLIHWVIVGGESGAGARPFELAWARSLIKQCRGAGVACFVKQLGKHPQNGGVPLAIKGLGSHGGAFDLWPEDLKVRQFLEVALG